ncbi:DEAD/DEAH box helicase domain-containing protein [Toxoplasma gondii ARI]|uniref:DEAD/DEAH box helicase domain-containing protein n=1 Tax=Toxoplasma gondii ARI TaxID=1074872 RepID=A0A139XLK6_TOXGO|nr:DEAD/DEAH box helicase domain-containing protein [Toxoplasma gondii ARI]
MEGSALHELRRAGPPPSRRMQTSKGTDQAKGKLLASHEAAKAKRNATKGGAKTVAAFKRPMHCTGVKGKNVLSHKSKLSRKSPSRGKALLHGVSESDDEDEEEEDEDEEDEEEEDREAGDEEDFEAEEEEEDGEEGEESNKDSEEEDRAEEDQDAGEEDSDSEEDADDQQVTDEAARTMKGRRNNSSYSCTPSRRKRAGDESGAIPGSLAMSPSVEKRRRAGDAAVADDSSFSQPRENEEEPVAAGSPWLGVENAPTFASLGVPPALIRTAASLHIFHPSPIQVLSLPHTLRGKNVCGLAPTGSGKTLGYCWPLLQRIGRGDGHAFMGLVLLPARELAIQVLDQFRIYGVQLGVRVCLLLGGRDLVEEGKLLDQCPHIVIATPGRMSDHVQNDPLRMKKRLSLVDVLVLDEADRLLSDEFEDDLKTILSCVPTSSQGRQTLLFSATVSPALLALQRRFGDDAMPLVDAHPTDQPALPNLSHFYMFVPTRMQPIYLLYLLEHTSPFCSDRGIVFAGSVRQTQQICTALEILKQSATPLHSLMEQRKRVACLEKFRSETSRLLICTDVAGRGLDLPRVEFVINMQVPGKAQDYVHRTGRTARAGRKGVALTFVDPKSVRAVHRIEALINTQLQPLPSINEQDVLKFLSNYSKVVQKSLLFLNEIGFDEKAEQHEEYTKAFKEARRKRRAQKAEIANVVHV